MATIASRTPQWARPVHVEPLTQAFPAFGDVREFRSKQCIFNHDRTRVFAVVSDRYQVVNHNEALLAAQQAIQKAFRVQVEPKVRTIGEGAGMIATFPLTQIKRASLTVKRGDLVGLELQLRNSYDGSTPFHINLSATRLVCTNGMTMGRAIASVNLKHFSGNLGDFGLISKRMDGMVEQGRTLEGVWRRWTDQDMTKAQAEKLLAGNFPAKYTKPILLEQYPMSVWDFYNHLTAMATHQTKTYQTTLDFSDKIARLFYRANDAVDETGAPLGGLEVLPAV